MKKEWLAACLLMACMTAFTPCRSQILGSWKQVSVKEIVTDKATGKKNDLTAQMGPILKMMELAVTFNADGTMLQSVKFTGSKPEEYKGTYRLSGDQLFMDSGMAREYKKAGKGLNSGIPPTVTVHFSGGNMLWHYGSEVTEEGKKFAFDIDAVYQRR